MTCPGLGWPAAMRPPANASALVASANSTAANASTASTTSHQAAAGHVTATRAEQLAPPATRWRETARVRCVGHVSIEIIFFVLA